MCEGHGHGKGASIRAETSYARALAGPAMVGLVVVATLNRFWPILDVPWLPGPGYILLLLASVLALRTYAPSQQQTTGRGRDAAAKSIADGTRERLLKKSDAMARLLAESLRFRTVSYDREDPEHKIDYNEFKKMDAWMQRSFPRVHGALERHVVNNHSRVYRWAGSESKSTRPYMVYAHLDVVPCPNASDWSVDPFAGEIKDGCVWGRGAIDLKNMVVGWMCSIEDLLEQGFRPRRDIYLAFGHDEEIGGRDGARHIAEWAEKRLGRDCFDFIWDEGLFVIKDLLAGHPAPVAMICCSEKGSATLRLEVETVPGHSSNPPAETAIGILARAVSRLERNPMPGHAQGPMTNTLGMLASGFRMPLRMLLSNLWLFGAVVKRILASKHKTATLVRTTTALTVFRAGEKSNVLPKRATAIVNHRVHPHDTVDDVVAYDKRVIGDARVKITELSRIDPSPVSDHRHVAFEALSGVVRAVYPGAGVAPGLFVANSDSRWFWDLSPRIYRFNPIFIHADDTPMFHGIDERIPIKNFTQIVLFCTSFVRLIDQDDGRRM